MEIDVVFEEFKAECQKVIDLLGLHDWSVFYDLRNLGRCAAQFRCDYEARVIWISFNKNRTTTVSIKEIARHEIVEGLLLGRLRSMAMEYHAIDEVNREVHRIVHILVNTVLKKE